MTATPATTPAPRRDDGGRVGGQNIVNPGLTRKLRRDVVENDAYARFTRRIIRAYARRVATGDVEALADLVDLSTHLDTAILDAVSGLRAFGYSWTEIATRLGITRQAAQQRWGGGEPR